MPQDGLTGNYNFRIEMRNTIEFFGTDFAIETDNWINALKTAKRVQDETEKSKDIVLFRNTDIFVALYRRKMGDKITERIQAEADQFLKEEEIGKIEIPEFLEKLEKAHKWLHGVNNISKFRP